MLVIYNITLHLWFNTTLQTQLNIPKSQEAEREPRIIPLLISVSYGSCHSQWAGPNVRHCSKSYCSVVGTVAAAQYFPVSLIPETEREADQVK